MRKIDELTITNYSDYAIVTYTPSFLNDFKRRIKITDAVLKLNVNSFGNQTDKYSVQFLDGDNKYLVDEFIPADNQNEVHINITDELQQLFYKKDTTIKFEILGVYLEKKGNKIIFEYEDVKSLFETKSTHSFDINRAGNIELDLNTGLYNLSHFDLSCSQNALPITINHYYESINANTIKDAVILNNGRKELFNNWCGKGWKTNFHQYLIKEKSDKLYDDLETSKKFTYIDGK